MRSRRLMWLGLFAFQLHTSAASAAPGPAPHIDALLKAGGFSQLAGKAPALKNGFQLKGLERGLSLVNSSRMEMHLSHSLGHLGGTVYDAKASIMGELIDRLPQVHNDHQVAAIENYLLAFEAKRAGEKQLETKLPGAGIWSSPRAVGGNAKDYFDIVGKITDANQVARLKKMQVLDLNLSMAEWYLGKEAYRFSAFEDFILRGAPENPFTHMAVLGGRPPFVPAAPSGSFTREQVADSVTGFARAYTRFRNGTRVTGRIKEAVTGLFRPGTVGKPDRYQDLLTSGNSMLGHLTDPRLQQLSVTDLVTLHHDVENIIRWKMPLTSDHVDDRMNALQIATSYVGYAIYQKAASPSSLSHTDREAMTKFLGNVEESAITRLIARELEQSR